MVHDYIDLKKDSAVYSKKYKRAYKGFSWTIFFFSYLAAFYKQDIKGGVLFATIDTIIFLLGPAVFSRIFPNLQTGLSVFGCFVVFRIIYGIFYNRCYLKRLKKQGYKPYNLKK